MRRFSSGFTLIEIMVVVAIVGILAAIAYPAYTESVLKGRRGEAKGALLEAAGAEERYFTTNNIYTTDLIAAKSKATSANGNYNLQAVGAAVGGLASGVVITASPVGFTDAKCGNLIYDSTGNKTISAGTTQPMIDYCWGK